MVNPHDGVVFCIGLIHLTIAPKDLQPEVSEVSALPNNSGLGMKLGLGGLGLWESGLWFKACLRINEHGAYAIL